MIKAGLTSVTFRNKTPQEVIRLAVQAGLSEIEWGGDIHVPSGQLEHAALIGRLTREAGLNVRSYGSYYRLGESKDRGARFEEVLQTAEALEAPIIRIWAGVQGSKQSSPCYRRKVIEEARGVADLAAERNILLAFEFHDDTLNDHYQACLDLLSELSHPHIKTYWQPMHGVIPEINGAGIDLILPWIAGVHVFHWWPMAEVRLPLAAGMMNWKHYFARLSNLLVPISANLEFVRDNSTEQFLNDANTLLRLLEDPRCSLPK